MDYAALKAELAKPAYQGLDDDAAAAALRAATVDAVVPVRALDVRRYLHLAGKWAAIVGAARGVGAPPADRQLAAIAMVAALNDFTEFDLSVQAYAAAIGAQLDAGVQAGLIANDDKAAILAKGRAKISPVEALRRAGKDVEDPASGDVAVARAMS